MAQIDNKNEVIEHLWLENEILWRNVRPKTSAPEQVPESVAEIDRIFASRKKWQSGAEDWRLVNEVEQRIGCLLNEQQLFAQFQELYDLAGRRKLAPMAMHDANKKRLFEKPPEPQVSEEQLCSMRFAYLFLLSKLQEFFIENRFERKLRARAAKLLSWTCVLILAVSAILVRAHVLNQGWSGKPPNAAYVLEESTVAGIGLALIFGLLGAVFSRITRFQSESAALQFDDVQTSFITPMMSIRLLSGLFGALIFYFFIRSGLLGGKAFPNLELLADLQSKVDSSAAGVTVAAPSKYEELAKLVVWSFIAGFSERLVPDTLVKMEGRASEAGK
jgi:hypothetical protein